ncbi:M23 family metallopeptidase [Bradyrhizobium sp. USDA 4502]
MRAAVIRRLIFGLVVMSAMARGAHGAEDFPKFKVPLNCRVGLTCFIQNYVDHDPTAETRDFHCGTRTYDGHDGTDFRIPSMASQRNGVEVMPVADGIILRARDGIEDVSIRKKDNNDIKGGQCGNGLVIEHAGGWSSQYCHLANGSLRAAPGQRVSAGQVLGLVGLSGETEFPHLHLTIRKDDVVVDPFAYGAEAGACVGGVSLWDLTDAVEYHQREILNFGFTSIPVTMDAIESGEAERNPVKKVSSLIAYVRAIGLRAGDEQLLQIYSPDGSLLVEHLSPPLEHDKAQAFVFVGRKERGTGWPAGNYNATYIIKKSGVELLRKSFQAPIDRGRL